MRYNLDQYLAAVYSRFLLRLPKLKKYIYQTRVGIHPMIGYYDDNRHNIYACTKMYDF